VADCTGTDKPEWLEINTKRKSKSSAGVVSATPVFSSNVQEQIGADVQAFLDEHFPDWIDDSAEQTWREFGGWKRREL
jgi:hypothetical protein